MRSLFLVTEGQLRQANMPEAEMRGREMKTKMDMTEMS